MPRFYFHLRENDVLQEDHDGLDLPDLDAALIEAQNGAKGMLAEAIEEGRIVDHQQFEVTDEGGTIVLVYPLAHAIRRPPD